MTMINLQTLTTFLGWCSVINVIVLSVASLMLMLMRNFVAGIHGRMFGVSTEDISLAYVHYLANYKIAIIMLNIVPYVALRIMSQ
jgi:hypothetical protein